MTLLFCLASIFVAAQVIGRAMAEDTMAREQVMWEACVRPGGGQSMTTRVTKSEDPMGVAGAVGLPLAELELTDEMEAAYIKAGGVHCPYCKAEDVQGEQFDVEFGEARQPMSCNACGATWVDSYKLVGVIP